MQQIQGTNDSSIVSKLSAANKGYFDDFFLEYFVRRKATRSPIINRGYYIRYKAIDAAFELWLSYVKDAVYEKTQIISLGAGFDTTFFRLKKCDKLPRGCKYIEVDFPEVLIRKLKLIKASDVLCDLLCSEQKFKSCEENPNIVVCADDYMMLGLNLCDPSAMECLSKCVDYSFPTLFLSECAMTYIDVPSSGEIISWAHLHFPNCTFIMYEQIFPKDAFGLVMQRHFSVIGSPLKSLLSYPDEIKQQKRFLKMGWPNCGVINMREFFAVLPPEEKFRIKMLEPFDEYEMWYEKCHHYVLIWAAQGEIPLPELFQSNVAKPVDGVKKSLKISLKRTDSLLQRFGHQLVLSNNSILISGGFGNSQKKHQRLSDLTLYNCNSKKAFLVHLNDAKDLIGQRMHHTMTKLSDEIIVIIGGRSSPNKVFDKIITLHCNLICDGASAYEDYASNLSVKDKGMFPLPTWRHSASVFKYQESESIMIFGGCSMNIKASGTCYILDTTSWKFLQLDDQECSPSPRHSHSSVTYNEDKVIITGGLSEDEAILDSIHVFDGKQSLWSHLNVSGLYPRFSHTSHIRDKNLFLVGGVTNIRGVTPGVAVVDLLNLQAIEYSLPIQDPEHPILLCNHCSCCFDDHIVIIGGGGNCFSFGTHFNSCLLTIDI